MDNTILTQDGPKFYNFTDYCEYRYTLGLLLSLTNNHTPFSLLFQKLRGLVRQKTTNSMPNPVAMGRAFFARHAAGSNHVHQSNNNNVNGGKSNGGLTNGIGNAARAEATLADVFGSKDAGLIPNKHRTFVMDTQVKYTVVS